MSAPLSLIIAVYNRPDALRLLLAALRRQTMPSFEVIVADDGSGPEIASLVDDASRGTRLDILHVRHDDAGWRKNAILNAAVLRASAPYLVFIDGDCVPHRCFLDDHWNARVRGAVLCGRRVDTSDRWTRALTLARLEDGSFERAGAAEWWDGVARRAGHLEKAIRLWAPLARLLHRAEGSLLGCNFSIHRGDLEAVNGFDERYDGPGFGEDSDLEFRLRLRGVRCIPLHHRAVLYHLYHPATAVAARSQVLYGELLQRREAWCRHGLRAGAAPAEPLPADETTCAAAAGGTDRA
jgi:glycosyltransferase involved in cell wall biosynthesis